MLPTGSAAYALWPRGTSVGSVVFSALIQPSAPPSELDDFPAVAF